jgi:hypothetical protein
MPAGSTYTPIATTTLGSAQASISFSSFSGYTDLILICSATTVTDDQFLSIRFNGDTGSNYSNTYMTGDGTTASSGRNTGTVIYIAGNSSNTTPVLSITHIQNYSNSTTYKTLLSRTTDSTLITQITASLWRSTSAITSMVIASGSNIQTGSTFTLYGIAAA